MTTLSTGDIDAWRQAVGRTERREEIVDTESLRRFAAAIGESLDVAATAPSLAHWAFFLPVVPPTDIGPDGHPKRGGFLPAITLPRRMFAGASMTFGARLLLGRPATRTSTIATLNHKSGKTGDLIFVEVDHVISQDGEDRVTERQTIVYRDAGDRTPAVEEKPQTVGADDVSWRPGPVDLFRFSAVTFNSHRIHYDSDYTRSEEGYPGLVVHGPFTAAKLYAYARARLGKEVRTFSFRAQAPLFVGQPVRLAPGAEPGAVVAIRCDGTTAMTALTGG